MLSHASLIYTKNHCLAYIIKVSLKNGWLWCQSYTGWIYWTVVTLYTMHQNTMLISITETGNRNSSNQGSATTSLSNYWSKKWHFGNKCFFQNLRTKCFYVLYAKHFVKNLRILTSVQSKSRNIEAISLWKDKLQVALRAKRTVSFSIEKKFSREKKQFSSRSFLLFLILPMTCRLCVAEQNHWWLAWYKCGMSLQLGVSQVLGLNLAINNTF